jgi:hypothetical protein
MRLLLLLLLPCWPAAAPAAVEIGFHSRGFGETFPHGFITLSGTVESSGERVDDNFGFTVRHLIGPSVLLGPVEGEVISESPAYVARGRRHFSMVLTDAQYAAVVALVERWRALPQPSYRLGRRNCVTFLAEVAALLGLRADPAGFMRRPRAFLDRLLDRNRARILARQGGSATRTGAVSALPGFRRPPRNAPVDRRAPF